MHIKNMTSGLMGKITLIAAELIVGILLLVNPDMFIQAVVIGVGILLIALGISACVRYFMAKPGDAMLEQSLSKGLIYVLIGFILALKSTGIINMLSGLYTVFGIALVVTGLIKIQWTVDFLRMRNNRYWYVTGISALISVIFGVLIVLKPGAINDAIGIVTGVFLIIQSAIDVTAMIFSLIRENGANKFRDRSNDDRPLRQKVRELDNELPINAQYKDLGGGPAPEPPADDKAPKQ